MEVHFTPDVQAKLDRLAMTGYDFHPEVENDFAEIWDFINRGKGVAGQIARLLSVFKGTNGGRFYVNDEKSKSMRPLPHPVVPGNTEWERFDNAERKVFRLRPLYPRALLDILWRHGRKSRFLDNVAR
jgi:hypothetical protein